MKYPPRKIYRTPEQGAFALYVEALQQRGFKKKAIGELCHLSPAAISMILSGERNPGPASLELLRWAVEGSGEGKGPAPAPPDEMHEKLGDLKEFNPEGFAAVKGLIQTLHKQIKKPVSAEKPSLHDLATKAHPLRAEVREQKPEADKPTENKSSRRTRASQRPKAQPTAPARAPSEPAHSNDS